MGGPLNLSDAFHRTTMESAVFDPNTVYTPEEVAERGIANYSTLAKWRHAKIGPPYMRLGKRVGYRGDDLNRWLVEQRVDTAAA